MGELIDIVIPDDQQEGTESFFGQWLIQIGDPISAHAPVAEINTDKAVVEIGSPCSGIIAEMCVHPDSPVHPGMMIGKIDPSSAEASVEVPRSPASQKAPASQPLTPSSTELPPMSPAVKRLVEKQGIDPTRLTGTGRGGRITKKDFDAFLGKSSSAKEQSPQGDHFKPSPILAEGYRVPHDHMRRRIAAHMEYSVHTAPHVTALFSCDLTAVQKHRATHRTALGKNGVQLTYTAYFISAAISALQEVPEVNSCWHKDELEVFTDCNIGVGTALADRGLVVPVMHKVQDLDLNEIAARLTSLTERARQGKLEPSDMQNGTFTISNHGVSGSLLASPIIIHQPQSAILGVGKLEKRAVVTEVDGIDSVEIRPMVYVTLTIDHRVLDAHQTNRYLTAFVDRLANWDDVQPEKQAGSKT